MPFSSHRYTLHLIFSPDSWALAKDTIESNDRILFLQDAVYLLQSDLQSPTELLYARALDVSARKIKLPGSSPNENSESDSAVARSVLVEAIDDELWVKLTTQAQNIISW